MNKTILITGTSTGIGRACALHLDELGYKVFAGVRRPEDADALSKQSSARLKPVLIDVAEERSIEQAVAQIKLEAGGQLEGLINNAGIGLGGALELTPTEEIQKVMNVNVTGLLMVTKACLPLLRKAKGRIINIGSTAGYLASPGASVYSGSKFAVRAITDALRRELHPLGIKVILISPGAINSAIWEKGQAYRDKMRKTAVPEIADQYSALRRFGDSLYTGMNRIPTSEVAVVAANALANKHPKRHYIVGKDAKGAKKATILPTAILDWIILKRIEKFAQK